MKKALKYLLIFLLTIVGIVIVLLFAISPIAKYEINKNCVQWTGRHITVGGVHLNPLTGSVFIKDLKVYEADSTTVFFDCHDIYVKINLKKVFDKNYEIDKIEIDKPDISIVQNGNKFNFDDLAKRFASDTTKKPEASKGPKLYYDVKNVIITNGAITYNNVPIHNVFKIHELNFKLPEISSENPLSKLHLDFNYGSGGSFTIDADANLKTMAYNLSLVIDKYDLSQYYTPINTVMKISSLKGQLNVNLRVHGEFNNPKDFSLVCNLNVKDLEVKDLAKRKLFALHEFSTTIDTINVKDNTYKFRSIILDQPYVEFDELEGGTNFGMAMVHNTKPVENPKENDKATDTAKAKRDYSNLFAFLQSSIANSAVDFLAANYHADSIAIRNGEFVFNDNTPPYTFHYKVSKINVLTDEIGANNKEVVFTASAALADTGKFAIKASIGYNLKKKALSYSISKLDISDISPIAKYELENNSVKWTGRQITTGGIKLDPLNGSLLIKDIKIYEADSTNVFFNCHDVYVQINLKKMTDNVYEIDKIGIDNPEISIVQNKNNFNFDDLVKRFASTDTTVQPVQNKGPGIHYDIKNISINNGNINYNNIQDNNVFKIHELNVSLPEVSSDDPQTNVHIDFNYGTSGFFNSDITADRNTSRYTVALSIDKYDLSQYYAPVNSFLSISSLKGELSTKLRIHGKFHNPKYVSGTGYIHINNLEIKDTNNQKVFALGELALDIDTVNVKHGIFYLHNVLFDRPFIRFDYLPNGNNISQMMKTTSSAPVQDTSTGEFKPDYSNVFTLIASSIKLMSVDFVNTNYHTDSIVIRNGQFLYNDYTLNTPFHCNISELNVTTDKISSTTKSLQFNIASKFNDTGRIVMNADMSLDMKNMLLNYQVSNFRLSDINPYLEYYVGVPFSDGFMNYQSTDSVINRYLKSTNIIRISGVRLGKKVETKPVYDMPIRTAIALMKDEKGNIDLNLPANGNLDDPNYKVGKLVGRVLKDVVVKTAASPFKLLAKIVNNDPEDMKQFAFEYIQDKLQEKQFSKLETVYKVLDKKKDLTVEIAQVTDSLAEKDELALFLAKKRYYDETQKTVNDSLLSRRKRKKEMRSTEKVSTIDTAFDNYLNKKLHLTGKELMTVEDKCIQFVGDSMLSAEVHELMEGRNKQVVEYLINKKSMHPERVKVVFSKDTNRINNIAAPEFDIKYTVEEN